MKMTFIGEQFRSEISRDFNLATLKKGHKPIELQEAIYAPSVTKRLNHFLVKLKHSDEIIVPDYIDSEILRFITDCVEIAKVNDLPIRNRFLYLTLDDKHTQKGRAQRTQGWHLDGLQGEEVPVKVPACYQFVWMNKLPFKYTTQDFMINGLDLRRHNIFDSLGAQVYQESVMSVKTNTLYLMNPYLLHEAAIAEEDVPDRLFLRLYVSELPITSVKMSINPKIKYPYDIHVTTGDIPDSLITWSPDKNFV